MQLKMQLLINGSVIRVVRHVGLALVWIFPAPMKGQAGAVGRQTAMQRR